MTLKEHLKSNHLNHKWIEDNLIFSIKDVGLFLVTNHKDGLLFDEKFNILLSDLESDLASNVNFFCFQFGGKWYYYSIDDEPKLNPLKYLENAKTS
jgi:hypothetical protein